MKGLILSKSQQNFKRDIRWDIIHNITVTQVARHKGQ